MTATKSSLHDFRLRFRLSFHNLITWLATLLHISASNPKPEMDSNQDNPKPTQAKVENISTDSTTTVPKTSRTVARTIRNKGENKAPSEASFLGIPGELRNEIYRFALLQDSMVKVSAISHEQPGLLRTCRQIRTEALPIWQTENTFKVDAWNMMLTIPSNYKHHWLSRIQYKSFFITMRGHKDWKNLKEWLRRYARHEVPGLAAGQPTTEAEVLAQAFELVYRMLGRNSFEQMEPVLEAWIKTVELAGVEFDFQ